MKSLLVEDSQPDARLIREMLREAPAGDFQLEHVRRLGSALERLRQEPCDLVLLDLGLPDAQGMKALTLTQQINPAVPIVILTGLDDERFALEAVRAGAQDYLIKGRFDAQLLVRTIRYAVERKRAEEEVRRLNVELEQRVADRTAALRESEERYRGLIETAREGIAIHEPDGTIAYVNQRMADMLGYSREELVGRSSLDFLDNDQREAVIRARESIKKRGSFSAERKLRRKDGSVLWTLSNVSGRRDSAGKFLGYLAMHSDITERKRAEEALRLSEERFTLAVNAAQEGVWDWNMETNEVWYSPRYKEMLGYSEEEIEHHVSAWLRLLHPDDKERSLQVVGAVLRGERDYEVEFRLRHKDGHYLDVLSQGFPIRRESDGKIVRIVGTHLDLTERKQVERKYRRLHETMREAFVVVDMAGRIRECNSAYWNMLGYSEEEVLKLTYLDLTPVKWHAGEQRIVEEQILKRGYSDVYEKEYRRKGGSVFPVELRTFLIRNDAGEPREMWAIVRDITERKRAEEALKQSEARTRADLAAMTRLQEIGALSLHEENLEPVLVKIVDAAIAITEADFGNIQLLDPATSSLVIRAQRGFPQWWLDYWRGVTEGKAVCGTALKRRERVIVEDIEQSPIFAGTPGLEIQLKAGVRAVQSTPLLSRSGKLLGMFSTHWKRRHRPDDRELRLLDLLARQAADIIDRAQAEEALRESEEQFRATFNVSSVGKAQGDPVTGRFLRVNAAYCRITGYTEAELLTRTVADLTHPEDREQDWASYCRMGSGQDAGYETEKRYIRRDGRVIWVHVCANLIRDAAGRPLRTAAVIQDITERKALQAELERLVAERTAKLQELVGELEHFSYSITHDMRAPLRGMQGFAEMMAEACEGCERQDPRGFLRRIRTSATRMDTLITDALNYNRTVRQELALEPVDVGGLLRGMLDSYPEFQSSRAHIVLKGEIPLVLGNEAGLTQCFSNLLGNAVKFVKPGQKPEICVWAELRRCGDTEMESSIQHPEPPATQHAPASTATPPFVRIWVEDKGIGVPKEMLPRVFNMFSRGHSSEAYEGTGIGLALVRKVVQRMGGRVGVESEEGKGSRFWVELRNAEHEVEGAG